MSENLVIVRACGDKAFIRALLSQEDSGALVCMPENADAIRRGDRPPPMLTFPKRDAFQYDEAAAKRARKGAAVDWTRLKPAFE